MEQLAETNARPKSANYFLIGFALSIFLQTEMHSVIRPTIGYYYGEFGNFMSYLLTYSLPVWREFAFFAVAFLAMSVFVPKSHSAVAKGIASCGLLNTLLLVAALLLGA